MGELVRVASVDEIPIGSMRSLEVNNRRVLVGHLEDGFFAVADECSHDYAPISTGRLKGSEVTCPRHGAKFDIRTGEPKAPPAVAGIDTFETKVENDVVYVVLD